MRADWEHQAERVERFIETLRGLVVYEAENTSKTYEQIIEEQAPRFWNALQMMDNEGKVPSGVALTLALLRIKAPA